MVLSQRFRRGHGFNVAIFSLPEGKYYNPIDILNLILDRDREVAIHPLPKEVSYMYDIPITSH